MRTPPTIIVSPNFVEWPKEMGPGHCFLWHMPQKDLTFYSVVLETDPQVLQAGYRLTRTFGGPLRGHQAFVLQDMAVWLLSEEQMTLARKLGWPQDEEALRRIFAVPPS